MNEKHETEYRRCVEMMRELVKTWEKIRPDEELLVLILPKWDQNARMEMLERMGQIIMNEKW